MRVLLFGATGMVGRGVLLECLKDQAVTLVCVVARHPTGLKDPRLREIVSADPASAVREAGEFDACFYCIGASAAGRSEAEYTRINYELTLTVATALAARSPGMTLIYVSGAGTDSSERGPFMWARVKGRTENALRRLPFKAVYLFRPGLIQPLDGIRSKTGWYRAFYAVTQPLYPLLKHLLPGSITSTRQVGRAMLKVAKQGYASPVLSTRDINRLA